MVLEKTLESPLDCEGIKPVNSKEYQCWIFIGRLMLKWKLHYFGYLMWRADSLEKASMLGNIVGKRSKGWQRMRWLHSITDSNGLGFEETLGDSEGQASPVFCGPWGHKELDMTWRLNNNNGKGGEIVPSLYLEDEWQVGGGRHLFLSSNLGSPKKGHLLWKTQCMHIVWVDALHSCKDSFCIILWK